MPLVNRCARTVAVSLALVATVSACGGTARAPVAARARATTVQAQVLHQPPGSPAAHWVDVTGQGVVRFDNGEPSPQAWAADPTPGVTIVTAHDDVCTLGPAVRSTADGLNGFITAGHCDPTTGDRMQSYNSSPDQRLVPLAAMTDVVDDQQAVDSGVIWTDRPPAAPLLADKWPVAGVLTREGVLDLPDGAPVCTFGARSGVVCGPSRGVDASGQLVFDAHTVKGDSGSPVFLVDSVTGAATLVGVLKGGDAVTTTATLLDPALDRLHANAVVDQAAARAVEGRPGYSPRITPAV